MTSFPLRADGDAKCRGRKRSKCCAHLLADRFQLVLRPEPGELTGYALRLAHPDGRLGPGIRRSEAPCVNTDPAPVAERQLRPGQPVPCGLSGAGNTHGGGEQRLAMVIARLRMMVGAEIVDKTGLTGTFDYYFTAAPVRPLPSAGPGTLDDPSVFTAVQEQLGMKLEPATIPTGFFLIDRAEQPEPN